MIPLVFSGGYPPVEVKRFPNAQSNPRRPEDIARFAHEVQSAKVMTIPQYAELPAEGVLNQIAVLNNGVDDPTLNWWDGTGWKVVTVT